MMECELAKCSNYVQPRSWSLERQWTAAIFHALCGVLGCSFFPRLEKQNQVPKFEPPDEIPIEMRIKVPISAFGKNKFRFLADKRGPDRDANLGPHFLLLPPPPRSLARASSFLPHKFFGLTLWAAKSSSSSSSLSHRSWNFFICHLWLCWRCCWGGGAGHGRGAVGKRFSEGEPCDSQALLCVGMDACIQSGIRSCSAKSLW